MARIIIKNVGPIKEAELELNKINVFMGPQSSGKSTIAKLISYCQWVEKRYIIDGNKYNYDVKEQLLKFHHLDENYFSSDSLFEYNNDFIRISYKGKNLKQTIKPAKDNKLLEYKKSKNIYIPAERNFVSIVPNIQRYREEYDNIFELLSDWSIAKSFFSKDNNFTILNLGVHYYFDKDNKKDLLILTNENNKEISFNASSSGLQSITPLLVIIERLVNYIYKVDFDTYKPNPLELQPLIELISKLTPTSIKDNKITVDFKSEGSYSDILKKRLFYHFTNFIIEEPEQNLFPATQRDLIYHLLEKIQSDDKEHSLTITTHSPYILYALNNCMLGRLVYDKMNEEDKRRVNCQSALIDPKKVSIYEIQNGLLNSIQQEDGLIGANYFDQNMKALMDDFYVFLKYYDDEE